MLHRKLLRGVFGGGLATVALLATPASSVAADRSRVFIPSLRVITLSAPLEPTSRKECSALKDEFDTEYRRAYLAHNDCQVDNKVVEAADGFTGTGPWIRDSCAFPICQSTHRAMALAWNRGLEQEDLCLRRLEAYEARLKREKEIADAEKARNRADTEKRKQSEDNLQALRNGNVGTRHEIDDSVKRDQARQQAEFDRDRAERAAQREASERDREATQQAERARKEAEERKQAEQNAKEADERSFMPRSAPERAIDTAADAAQRERDARDQSLYQSLVSELKQSRDAAVLAFRAIQNPFRTALDLGSKRLSSGVVGKAIDLAAPIGPEKHDSGYDGAAFAVDSARRSALGKNPFAERIARVSMDGVNKINRQTLGALDELGRAMDQVGASPSPQPTPVHETPRPIPISSTPVSPPQAVQGRDAPAQPRLDDTVQNPFEKAQPPKDDTVALGDRTPGGYTSPIAADPDISTVNPKAGAPGGAVDDSVVNGKLQCSAKGRGRVIPECERRRKSGNPFAAK